MVGAFISFLKPALNDRNNFILSFLTLLALSLYTFRALTGHNERSPSPSSSSNAGITTGSRVFEAACALWFLAKNDEQGFSRTFEPLASVRTPSSIHECISLRLAPDANASKNTVFRVTHFNDTTVSGSNGGPFRTVSTSSRSHGGNTRNARGLSLWKLRTSREAPRCSDRSRTSSVGKVDDSESGGPQFESRHGHLRKNLLVLLDKALYLRLSWIMTTFCPSIMRMEMAP